MTPPAGACWSGQVTRFINCRRRHDFDHRATSDAALALNLSYVLHEPSTSLPVREAVATVQRTQGQNERAVRRLARLSSTAFIPRVVFQSPEALHQLQTQPVSPIHVLTLTLGGWTLLPRLVALHTWGIETTLWLLERLPLVGPALAERFVLFGAPTRIALPAALLEGDTPVWFAAAALRPGGRSVLVTLEPLDGPAPERQRALAGAIEAVLRGFWPQWTPARALWPAPAEATLPDVLGEG